MKKRTIIWLSSCFVFATVTVVSLYAMSDRIVHRPNSFFRDYRKYVAVKANEIDLEYNSWYIAGVDDEHIYLGNIMAPFNMIVTNLTLTDTQHVQLRFKDPTHSRVYQKTTIKISLPYFYMADGFAASLYRGKIGEWIADRFMYDSAYFTQLVPISPSSFAIRTNSVSTLDNVLGKEQKSEPHVKLNPALLVKQVDGVFCTEGDLHYNNDLNKLIYTYRYRNGYIVYDTNLNLEYRGHTIDTFMRTQIKVGYVKSNDTKTLTYKKNINIASSTSGNYLFIYSNLMAKNDYKDFLSSMSPIDVYDLIDGSYKFSFTIINYDDKVRLSEFYVHENKILVALFDHHLVRYDLQSQHFNDSRSSWEE